MTKEEKIQIDIADKIIKDIGNDKVILLGGRPAVGKTAVAMQIASKNKIKTLYFSLGNTAEYLVSIVLKDILGALEGCNNKRTMAKVKKRNITPERLKNFQQIFEKNGTFFEDNSCDIAEIFESVETYKLKFSDEPLFVIIDYIQLLNFSSYNLTQILQKIKEFSKKHNITFLLLSHLQRSAEDNIPSTSDIIGYEEFKSCIDEVVFLPTIRKQT